MNRWAFILEYFLANPAKIVLDIGVDHGKFPIKLLQEKLCNRIIASDIRVNPLKIAKKNFAKANLLEKVDFRLGDGLSVIGTNDKEVDACLICGLGANSIISILSKHFSKVKKYLIQSPNQIHKIRAFCLKMDFYIELETVNYSRGRYYETIVINPNKKAESITEYEIFFGKYNLINIHLDNIKNYYLKIFKKKLKIFKNFITKKK